MRIALDEAMRPTPPGVVPDLPIGAIVLDPNAEIIARARNQREATGDPTAHAEVLALREAAAVRGQWRLTDCT
ncbi:MAG: deaminase, partial [Candidatus Nanopelagicales bacterium]